MSTVTQLWQLRSSDSTNSSEEFFFLQEKADPEDCIVWGLDSELSLHQLIEISHIWRWDFYLTFGFWEDHDPPKEWPAR